MGKVFLSYCHKDAHYLADLRQHAQRLEESKLIGLWCDEAIAPGDSWADPIRRNLDDSRLVIALVSPDFLQSEWCVAELGRAFELREKHPAAYEQLMRKDHGRIGSRHSVATLQQLLRGQSTVRLSDARDDFWLPVVRLYFDGVLEERDGRTEFRCEAARIGAKRAVAVWEERES